MKIRVFLWLGCMLGSILPAISQDRNPATYEPGDRAQAVYVELLGPGISYSFNYDTRFQDTRNGLGGRIGLSYLAVEGDGMFTLPVMVNYLLGKEGKYFEMGVGGTYVSYNTKESADSNSILFVEESGVVGTTVFGYRRQPEDGGFLFRAGISPVFGKGYFVPYFGYISFGYAF